jgi:hypothetical protein
MEFGESLTGRLPAPRDDEPAGLRQDIVDELADHLACGARREILRGTEPASVRRSVMERFGDPAALARRLWMDAMKEKIMGQRVLIATCLVVTAASLALVGMFWLQSTRAARELAETNRRMAETIIQNQATNLEILKRLQVLAETDRKAESAEWIPVSFKLTQETLDGPPAVDYEVSLGSGSDGYQLRGAMERVSDSSGNVDFGVVRPGDWSFQIRKASDEEGSWWETTGALNVLPGSKISRSIVCPRIPTDDIPVRVLVDWPSDLSGKGLRVVLLFVHDGLSYQPSLKWSYRSARIGGSQKETIVCGPDVTMARVNDKYFDLWRVVSREDAGPVFADVLGKDVSHEVRAVDLERDVYRLRRLIVLRTCAIPDAPFRGERFEVLGYSSASTDFLPWVGYVSRPPSERECAATSAFDGWPGTSGVTVRNFWRQAGTRFEVVSGRSNEWKIPIPEELAQAVRTALESDEKSKDKAAAKAAAINGGGTSSGVR